MQWGQLTKQSFHVLSSPIQFSVEKFLTLQNILWDLKEI